MGGVAGAALCLICLLGVLGCLCTGVVDACQEALRAATPTSMTACMPACCAACALPQGLSARGSSADGSALAPRLPDGRPTVSQPSSGRLGGMGAAAGTAVAGGPAYVPTAEEQQNDYTVLPIDLSRWVGCCACVWQPFRPLPAALAAAPSAGSAALRMCYSPLAPSSVTHPQTLISCLSVCLAGCRYAATAGNEGESIPLGPSGSRSPLPTEFSRQLAGVFLCVCLSVCLPGFWLASWALR